MRDYNRRADMENRIAELKHDLAADDFCLQEFFATATTSHRHDQFFAGFFVSPGPAVGPEPCCTLVTAYAGYAFSCLR